MLVVEKVILQVKSLKDSVLEILSTSIISFFISIFSILNLYLIAALCILYITALCIIAGMTDDLSY